MVIVVGFSLVFVLLLILSGFALAVLAVSFLEDERYRGFTFVCALALVFGFAFSGFSAAWSYGLLGIDTFPLIYFGVTLISWVVSGLILVRKKSFRRLNISKGDAFLILPVCWTLFLARFQWESFSRPRLAAGDGPDTSQNLMAALSTRSLGDTWFSQAEKFYSFFGHESLRQSVYDLFRWSSFREQAGIDYLVFGTRWGLSVPYSQILKVFGEQAILWEVGIVLVVGLISTSVIVFGLIAPIVNSRLGGSLAALMCISNAALLFQYANGGLSQIWAMPGMLATIFVLMLLTQNSLLKSKSGKALLMALATSGWLIMFSTYVDAAIILTLVIALVGIVFMFVSKKFSLTLIKIAFTSGVLTLAAVPALTYATFLTFDFRLKAASGTGINTSVWPLPSELLGFVDVISGGSSTRSVETLLIGVIITFTLILGFVKTALVRNPQREFGFLGLVGLLAIAIGWVISYTGKLQISYTYAKVGVYVAPLIIMTWVLTQETRVKLKNLGKTKTSIAIIGLLAVVSASSGISATANLDESSTKIPYGYANFLANSNLQEEIASNNYLIPYTASSNFFGVLGNIHWISKAPNDIVLGDRVNRPLYLMCFSTDPGCKPITSRVPNRLLEENGIFVYVSPITSAEFMKLPILERYKYNFTVFGQPVQEIPERFLGGNPYFN
jgi:hypothetical protein